MIRYALVPVIAFALGWSGVAAVRAAPAAWALFQRAHENKFLMMAGVAGPVTWVVQHDELEVLERLAREDPSVLGAEQFALPSSVAVAFTGVDAPGIRTVAALPGTRSMVRRRVPMICH